MKCNPCVHAKRFRVALFLFAATLLLSLGVSVRVTHVPRAYETNNPQDFYLWATDASFAYSFRYDPRATDNWLFISGGDARSVLCDSIAQQGPTNR